MENSNYFFGGKVQAMITCIEVTYPHSVIFYKQPPLSSWPGRPGCRKTLHIIGRSIHGGRPPSEKLIIPMQPYCPNHCHYMIPLTCHYIPSFCGSPSRLNPRRKSLRSRPQRGGLLVPCRPNEPTCSDDGQDLLVLSLT